MLVELIEVAQVFPAHAGMSPARGVPASLRHGFPRSRGDEPISGYLNGKTIGFSPLTRG